MVKLTPAQQAAAVGASARAFVPVPGSWGARGATYIVLGRAVSGAADPAAAMNAVLAELEGVGV